jgi:hypothetical protein
MIFNGLHSFRKVRIIPVGDGSFVLTRKGGFEKALIKTTQIDFFKTIWISQLTNIKMFFITFIKKINLQGSAKLAFWGDMA